jgi:hypothetical protein|tara:strand:- start:246 stop:419 length:174 start_codon:yes stop_codon:yes gene_type:complete
MTERQEKDQIKRILDFQALLKKGWEKSEEIETKKSSIGSMSEINLGSSPALINGQWI